jgi:antitoxin (DNA-binding transcriptional repressor) of toxin-antitoxin stability system
METFSFQALPERTSDLLRELAAGRLSLVTRHGQPLFVSVPFSGELLDKGVRLALAIAFFKQGYCSVGKAAEV